MSRWMLVLLGAALGGVGAWAAQRTQAAERPSAPHAAPQSSMVITPSNPDPKMVITPKNPDPKMVVTPPWPEPPKRDPQNGAQ